MAERVIVDELSGAAEDPSVSVEDGEPVGDEELLVDAPPAPGSRARESFRSFGSGAPKPFGALPLREGDVVAGRYRVERVLGRDGHELVLSVRHLELDERALMRVLLPEASVNPDAVTRFRRGARRSLEHRSEHTEHVLDFGRLSSGSPYKIVELPRGPSLHEVLRIRGELPLSEAADIAVTICEALAEVHASRSVFRNLSPANVYLERRQDGTSFARLVSSGGPDDPSPLRGDELTIFGTAASVESLSYAAPEQFRSPSAVDQRADIWSLGAIIYQLLTGLPPFPAETSVALIAMIAADAVEPPSALRHDVDPELDEIVLRCLEKNPAHRPQTVGELVELLLPFASEQVHTTAERVRRVAMRSLHPSAAPAERASASTWTSASPSGPASLRASYRERSVPPPLRSERADGPRSVRPTSRGHGGAGAGRSALVLVLGAAVGAIAAVAATLVSRPAPHTPMAQSVMAATPAPVPPAPSATVAAPPAKVVAARPSTKPQREKPHTEPSDRALEKPESVRAADRAVNAADAPKNGEQAASAALFDGID
jgi:serine/threonine protein kinase